MLLAQQVVYIYTTFKEPSPMHIIALHSFHKNTFLLMWLHNSKRVEAGIMVQVVLWDTACNFKCYHFKLINYINYLSHN